MKQRPQETQDRPNYAFRFACLSAFLAAAAGAIYYGVSTYAVGSTVTGGTTALAATVATAAASSAAAVPTAIALLIGSILLLPLLCLGGDRTNHHHHDYGSGHVHGHVHGHSHSGYNPSFHQPSPSVIITGGNDSHVHPSTGHPSHH
jgi:hypothetical protein